jgi:hypothetical protein
MGLIKAHAYDALIFLIKNSMVYFMEFGFKEVESVYVLEFGN